MSEKGGKDYSPFDKGAPLRGKDDSATKSAKQRKVQFSNEGSIESRISNSPKSGGNAERGKGVYTANGGKTHVSKGPQPIELKIEHELPENVKCLMDCEAADILQGIQEQMVMLSRDPSIKIPISFDRGLQYAKRNSQYTNSESVRRILEYIRPLTKYGISNGEICVIANVCPETVDEVFALVPLLKGKRSVIRQPLKDVLSELAKLKQSL